MKVVLELKDYKVYYRTFSGYVRAVDGVNLEIREGEILGLIGESGSGKSTLATGLVRPRPPLFIAGGSARLGEIELTNISEEERRKLLLTRLAIVPQYSLDALPVIKRIRGLLKDIAKTKGVTEKEVIDRFNERRKIMGLPENVVDMYPVELSGGMRQRVVISLATLFSPDLLVTDEPTSALDVSTQRRVLELLRDLRDRGIVKSILFITHDIAAIRQIADRIAVMYAGKIVEVGDVEDMVNRPYHPYTRALRGAVPTIGINYKLKKLVGLGGNPPDLRNPPSGCRFHPRCPYVTEVCRSSEPKLTNMDGRLVACWLASKLGGQK